jgi:hypothetical protein
MRHHASILRPETISFNRLCSSLPRDLPKSCSVQSLTDKQLVPVSETTASSVADNATGVQNPSTSQPQYPPIVGVRAGEKGITHNLMTDFVDMSNLEGFGVVMNLGELMTWIVGRD